MAELREKSKASSKFVSFILGEEEYGVDIDKVHEIIRIPEITSIPQRADYFAGIINLRGKVIPVINLRKRFGFEEVEEDSKQRIIVIEIERKITGVIVDSVNEVLDIEAEKIDEAPSLGSKVNEDYIKGMAKLENDQLMILLDMKQILDLDANDHKVEKAA